MQLWASSTNTATIFAISNVKPNTLSYQCRRLGLLLSQEWKPWEKPCFSWLFIFCVKPMYLFTICTLMITKIQLICSKSVTLWSPATHFAFSTTGLSALPQQDFKHVASATTAKTPKPVNPNGTKWLACTCGNSKQQPHASICCASGTIKFIYGLNITCKNVCQFLGPVPLLGSTTWSWWSLLSGMDFTLAITFVFSGLAFCLRSLKKFIEVAFCMLLIFLSFFSRSYAISSL